MIAEYEAKIEKLTKHKPSLPERYKAIEDLNEEYFQKTGNNLPSFLLTLLTNWILVEDLSSKDIDKVTNSQFPILSRRQLRRRKVRERCTDYDVLDFFNQKYLKRRDSLAKTSIKKRSE